MKRRRFIELASHVSVLGALGSNLAVQRVLAGETDPVVSDNTGLFLDDRLAEHVISPEHPESPARYYAIRQALVERGLVEKTSRVEPVADVLPWLLTVHTEKHIRTIRQYYGEQAHENVTLVTAGLLAAVDRVCEGSLRNAFCATRPPGHHALNTGQEEGFCYYNHIAIAARYAQQKYGMEKILIADWDYHHGNGTEAAFYSDPSVLFFSTHDAYAYPGTGSPDRAGEGDGKGFNINVHLGCGASDKDIIQAFEQQLISAANQFKPDLILISAGFDSREHDRLGCHEITDEGFVRLTEIIMELADKHCQGRIVSLLEGGYNIEGTARAVCAHLETLIRT